MRVQDNRPAAEAAAVFALGLTTRWTYVHEAGDHILWNVPVADAIGHLERAAGGPSGFTSMYDVLLAGALGLGDASGAAAGDHAVIRGAQVALGACNCVLAWWLACSFFSARVALVAGFATALYGPSIYFSGELQPAVLATTLVLVGLVLLTRTLSLGGDRLWLAGLLLGLSVLTEWWVCLFVLGTVLWLLLQRERITGHAPLSLALGALAPVGAAFLWTAWTPSPPLEAGAGAAFSRLYALWQGSEFLTELDPYYWRQQSALLSALMWDRGLAFPFGLVAPAALLGVVSRLRARRGAAETALLLFVTCFTAQALLFPVDSATRASGVPVLLIMAAAGVAALQALPWRRGLAACAVFLVLVAGLSAQSAGEAGRARQHHWLGVAFEQLDLRVNALREFEEALALNPNNRDAYYALADRYLAGGDNVRAGGLFERLLERWPNQDRARKMLSEQYMKSGRAAEAATLYRQLIAAGADSTEVLLRGLGAALVKSGDLEGGLEAYRKASALAPESQEIHQQLALLFDVTGRLREAIEAHRFLFEEKGLLEVGPAFAEALIRDHQDERAEAVLQQILREDPQSADALALRGKQLFLRGHHREAAGLFERLRSLWPEDYRVYFFLAKIYQELGEKDEAHDAYLLYRNYRKEAKLADAREDMQFMVQSLFEKLKTDRELR